MLLSFYGAKIAIFLQSAKFSAVFFIMLICNHPTDGLRGRSQMIADKHFAKKKTTNQNGTRPPSADSSRMPPACRPQSFVTHILMEVVHYD